MADDGGTAKAERRARNRRVQELADVLAPALRQGRYAEAGEIVATFYAELADPADLNALIRRPRIPRPELARLYETIAAAGLEPVLRRQLLAEVAGGHGQWQKVRQVAMEAEAAGEGTLHLAIRRTFAERELSNLAEAVATGEAAERLAEAETPGGPLATGLAAHVAETEALRARVYWRTEPLVQVHSEAGPLHRVGLFVKTCARDAERLKFLFASIDKYCEGFAQLVIVSDTGFVPDELPTTLPVAVAYETVPSLAWSPDHRTGYWHQQGVKMTWFRYTNCDAVVVLDSDVVVTGPMTPATFIDNGAPIMGRARWDELIGPNAMWKLSADYILGAQASHAYMLRPGTVLTAKASRAFSAYCEAHFGVDAMDLFLVDPHGIKMSEFEMFGAYLGQVEDHGYRLTELKGAPQPIKKFQSVLELTAKQRAEIDTIIA